MNVSENGQAGRSVGVAIGVRLVAAVLLMGAVVLGGAGCASARAGDAGVRVLRVALSSGNRILQDGREIAVSDLPDRLKSMGAGRATRIEVLLAEDTSTATTDSILATLVQAGLPKVVLIRAAKASSFRKERVK